MLERHFHDAVAFSIGVFLRDLILHDVDADHQPTSAHVAHQLQLLRPVGHAFQNVMAHAGRVFEEMFFLNHIECSQSRRNRHRIAAESRCVRSRNPVHDLSACHCHPERHTRSNALRHANHIGLDAGVFDGKPLAGASNTALHFVHHQHDAVTIADAPQFLHKDRRSHNVTAFALHRLDKDRRNFLRSQCGLEQFFFNEARTTQRKVVWILRAAHATAIYIRIAHMRHARH